MTTKLRKEFRVIKNEIRHQGNAQKLIKMLEKNKRSFYMRDTMYMTTLIYDNTEIVFPKRNNAFPTNQLWLFKSVKNDAEKLAAQIENGEVEFVMPEKNPANRTNNDYDDSYGEITGTDINSAYWTIAHNLKIISTKTYKKAQQNPESKVTRLAALAILGRNLSFKKYEDGLPTKEKKIIEGSRILQEFYKTIRYTCYEYMTRLSEMLGDDFDAYRTDCIYYRDSPENRKKVYDFLDQHGFYYKQLEFDEDGFEIEDEKELK